MKCSIARLKMGRNGKLQFSDSKITIKSIKDFQFKFSYCMCKKQSENVKFTLMSVYKKLHFKMHSDTTLICSVQPVFLNFDGKNSLPTDAFFVTRRVFLSGLKHAEIHTYRHPRRLTIRNAYSLQQPAGISTVHPHIHTDHPHGKETTDIEDVPCI